MPLLKEDSYHCLKTKTVAFCKKKSHVLNMGLIQMFLSAITIAFRALESLGVLWDVRLKLSDIVYGRNGVTVRSPSNPILKLPAGVIAEKVKERSIKAEEIIQAFIARIHEVNPLLNAVVNERFEEALEEARYIDTVLDSPDSNTTGVKSVLLCKPLLGVPLSVKESIACKGFAHSAGLVDRKETIAEDDATVVKYLRQAGAIPIAMTNCSELCMWWETSNNVYGRTNNPYDTSKIAGGSSGGEGGIISAAGSVCGVGSDVGKCVILLFYDMSLFLLTTGEIVACFLTTVNGLNPGVSVVCVV